MSLIYHLDSSLLNLLIRNQVRIQRPKLSVFKLILTYCEMEDKTVNMILDGEINYDDIILTMLEEKADDDEIMDQIYSFEQGWNLETILSLAIMKKRYLLIQKLIDMYN